ncbi:zinc metalloproteinase-disintegrin-like EoMP06 [Rhipicephalus sanguineus]|uniref:zinc metalloproteinase-disintegrin-like EoMP06 n=1 Tax=Rhipicephalus sanguineus TaxID=34632 RepID=UPI001894DAA3|nr:zinc metalloproteinase-disintegrin-like EoMP06 [Rhipicephalus sanguineus]
MWVRLKSSWNNNFVVLLAVLDFALCAVLAEKTEGVRQDFLRYERVHPKVISHGRRRRDVLSLRNDTHQDVLQVMFKAFGQPFTLDLRMKKDLLPLNYFEKHHGNNNSHIIDHPMKRNNKHCYYHGTVRGRNNSWAAVSTCNGLSGVVFDGKGIHYIHPDPPEHLFLKASDMKEKSWRCGFNDSLNLWGDTHSRAKRSVVIQPPFKSNARSRYVELLIVNDNKEFIKMKRNKEAVFERSKQIANIVNALYAPLNIFIALVGVIVWTEHDEIVMSSDGDATLTKFLQYRRERLAREHPNDNAQLITDIVLDSSVVGKALKGPICTYEYSGGVNKDHHEVVGVVATTVAHELGHNFGMEHDDKDTKCQCPEKRCIMASATSNPPSPSQWSSCSKHYLQSSFEQGMDFCLWNLPEDIMGPVCGNGFLEEGEQCDCGPAEFCKNPCCEASTCKFKGNAKCAIGACCDISTCQVVKAATLCRDAITECDLPEYCDGVSEFCPVDVFVQDGTECGGGKAYCFGKQCRSHDDQCQLLWGSSGRMADQRCFERNDDGEVNANCGYNRLNKTYKKCNKEDVMCGTLHCVHLNERLEFGIESAAVQSKFYIDENDKRFTCRSAIVDLGLFTADVGQSPNGAKCGTNKACMNQKCVPIEKLYGIKCPYDCYNNGVCNSRGNCHCMVGYAPPYCNYPGPGGSSDSGPASDPSAGYSFMVSMYIIFLCIVPLAVITSFSIYYFRRHLKTWWMTKARKAAIKSRAQQVGLDRRGGRPLSKFSIDAEAIKALNISSPVAQHMAPQEPLVPSAPPLPPPQHQKPNRSVSRERGSFRSVDISGPVLQSSSNSHITPTRPAPARPAPARPAPGRPAGVQRAPSCPSQGSMRGRSRVARSASQRSNGPRPAQPPPPRPPAPPDGSLYDDCTTLEFAGTPLAFVHNETNSSQRPLPNRPLPARPTPVNTRPATGVAALAMKFERNAAESSQPLHGRAQPMAGQRSHTTTLS